MAAILVRMLGDSSQLERSFKRANSAAGGFNRKMSKTGKASTTTQKGMRGIGSSVRLASGAFLGGAGLVAGITSTLKKTADFEKSLNTFQAVSGATADQMKAVSTQAQTLGADFTLPATSAGDAALAMTELAKGGLTVKQAMAAAKGTLQLAAAGGVSVTDAATTSARALNAFGLNGDKAGKVADVLANAANASTGEISDFALGLQQSSASAKQYGLTIEDTATALGLLANKGIVGSDAGTSLKTMLSRLVPQTKASKEKMDELGVAFSDADGNLIPFRDQIVQYRKALERLTPVERQKAIQTIFGSDAQRAANIILGGGVAAYDKMHTTISRQGAAAQIAAAKQKGLAGAMDGLKSVVESLQILVGTQLAPALTTYLNQASKWLANSKNQKTIMDAVKGAVAAVTGVLRILRTIMGTLNTITGSTANTVKLLVGAFVLFKTIGIVGRLSAIATQMTRVGTTATVAQGKVVGLRGVLQRLTSAPYLITFALVAIGAKVVAEKIKALQAMVDKAEGRSFKKADPVSKILIPRIAKQITQMRDQGLTSKQILPKLRAQYGGSLAADDLIASGFKRSQQPTVVHTTVTLDKRVVGKTVTEAQRKQAKQTGGQRRGVVRRSGV